MITRASLRDPGSVCYSTTASGPLSAKTSYRQISWSLEAAGLDAIIIVYTAVEVPVKFQSD